eukprot:GHVQ01003100.1.p1 GENE.GHVQ01003100.1~~GHVQ01003100.1.p1  ORF type:complete len:142 (-),score=9.50 GHVQ01003100.1:513-938(-)
MEKAGKLPEEFFNETDKSLIEQLKKGNTAIPDAVTTYHLQRVGCTTSDPTVVRLLSLVSQVALEKVLDDARIIATFKASATGSPQTPTTDDIVNASSATCLHVLNWYGIPYLLFRLSTLSPCVTPSRITARTWWRRVWICF